MFYFVIICGNVIEFECDFMIILLGPTAMYSTVVNFSLYVL